MPVLTVINCVLSYSLTLLIIRLAVHGPFPKLLNCLVFVLVIVIFPLFFIASAWEWNTMLMIVINAVLWACIISFIRSTRMRKGEIT